MTEQINVKLSPGHRALLQVVAKYEGAKLSELVREWIRAKLKRYQTNPRFKRYLRTHPEEKDKLWGPLP